MAFTFVFPINTFNGSNGTVTSVGLSMPNIFDVTHSPVTAADTLTVVFVSQTQNLFLASPDGVSGVPTFRSIIGSDLPVATTSIQGVLPIATNAEALAGTVTKYVTPTNLSYTLGNYQIGSITPTNSAIGSTDTINGAFAKAQGQINAKQDTLTFGDVIGTEFSITGGAGAIIGSGLALALAATAVAAGTYGNNTTVPVFTVDAKGRITGVTNTAINFPPSGVTAVFGRTGAVTAQSGDYTFAQIATTPTTVSGYGITDAVTTGSSASIANATLTGTAGAGYINLRYQSSNPSGLSNYTTLYANSVGNIAFKKNANTFDNTFIFNGTASRTYTWQDLSGTVAMLDAGQIFTSATWNGTAIADSYISSASTWNAKVSGSGLTTNYHTKWNGTVLVNGLLIDDGTGLSVGSRTTGLVFDLGNSGGHTRPYQYGTSNPSGTAPTGSTYWTDNGSNICGLWTYKPYSTSGSGWYQLMDTDTTFTTLRQTGADFGIGLESMSQSNSTIPTLTVTGNGAFRNLSIGGNYGIGNYQNGNGTTWLKPFQGAAWFTSGNYLNDWDGGVIGTVANGGRGTGSNIQSALSSTASTLYVIAGSNSGGYYSIEYTVVIDNSGNPTSLTKIKPSSNTSNFDVNITGGKIAYTNVGGSNVYSSVKRLSNGLYANLMTYWQNNLLYSADAQTMQWAGTGGIQSSGGFGIKTSGANAPAGIATLVAGTVTVSNVRISSTTIVRANRINNSGTVVGSVDCTATVSGTSFTLTSGSTLDTSTVFWEIIQTY